MPPGAVYKEDMTETPKEEPLNLEVKKDGLDGLVSNMPSPVASAVEAAKAADDQIKQDQPYDYFYV